jgi:uncharacterized protein (DUF1778 family)
MARSPATERFEARLTRRQKDLLRRAAELRGQSLTDFVLTTAQEAAERAVQSALVIELSLRDQQRLVGALSNPSSPNSALRKAAETYNNAFAKKR